MQPYTQACVLGIPLAVACYLFLRIRRPAREIQRLYVLDSSIKQFQSFRAYLPAFTTSQASGHEMEKIDYVLTAMSARPPPRPPSPSAAVAAGGGGGPPPDADS